MSKTSTPLILALFVALTNSWIWKVSKIDLITGIMLIFLSMMLVYLTYIKLNLKFFLLAVGITLFLGTQVLFAGFDNHLLNPTPEQLTKFNTRHGYFSIHLGIFFNNKISQHFYRDLLPLTEVYESNVYNSLSPNLYFFGNHPRERGNVLEFSKYPSFFVVPFLLGLFAFCKCRNYFIGTYIIFLIVMTGLIRQNYNLGPVLLMPAVNLFLTVGVLNILKYSTK